MAIWKISGFDITTGSYTNPVNNQVENLPDLAFKEDVSQPFGYVAATVSEIAYYNNNLQLVESGALAFQDIIESTSLLYLDGLITINSTNNTRFDVPAGYGVIVDNTVNPITKTTVTWTAFTSQATPYLNSATNTFIGIKNVNGIATLELTQDLQTPAERPDVIVLGWLEHLAGTVIEKVGTEPDFNVNIGEQLQQYLESIGAFNIEGNDVTASGGNLKLNISSGTIFDNGLGFSQDKRRPNHYVTNSISNVPLKYTYRNNSGGWYNALANVTDIDPNHYDDGSGTLQSVPSGKWTIQRVYYYAPFGYLDVYYDQKYYNSKEEALNGYLVDQVVENSYLSYDIPLAIIVVKSGITDASIINDCEIRSVNDKSIGGAGAGGGEINTASNIGTEGVGVFKQKLGVDLQFKNIKASNSSITVQEDGSGNIGLSATEQNVIKYNIKGIKDASTYSITPSAGDIYILTNLVNKHTSWGTLYGGTENCLVIYDSTFAQWNVLRNASLETVNGNLQVYNFEDSALYNYNKTASKWVKNTDVNKQSKLVYVDPVKGTDTTASGSIHTPYKTLTYALTQVDNSGYRILLFPGTYTEGSTIVVSKLNLAIIALGTVTGNTLISSIVNVSNASSTVAFEGIAFANLTVSGAGNCYLTGCRSSTSVTKSGAGYFQALNCGFDSSGGTSITGAGSCVFDGGQQGFVTINNAGALVTVKNNISMYQSSVSAGLLDLQNATVYSSTNTANAVTTSSGTTFSVNGSRFVTPSGTSARLSIGGIYAISDTSFDYNNTTFGASSVNLDNESFFNKLRVDGGGKFQFLDFAYNPSFKKAYASGAIVYNNSNLYIANASIPVGTTFTEGTAGATWKKITNVSSGGGSSILNPQLQVAGVFNAIDNPNSEYNVYFNDDDLVVLTNITNKISFWNITLTSGQTLYEGDIIKYRSATTDWVIDTQPSQSTTILNGNYQIFDLRNRTVWYFDKDYMQWHEFHADEYYKVQVTGNFTKGFAGNITSDLSGLPVYKQVTIGTTSTLGTPTSFGIDSSYEIATSLLDGGRVVSFYWSSNTYYMQVGTVSSNTITYGTATTIGSCYKGMAFSPPTGGIITLESSSITTRGLIIRLFNWNGTSYIQSATTSFEATNVGFTDFYACMNANNTLEIVYELLGGVTKRAAVLVGSTTLTQFSPVQISASSIGTLGLFTFGISGRCVLLYRNVSNTLVAKGINRLTDGTYSEESSNLIQFTEGNNNQDRLTYASREGKLLMFYWFNNNTYCRWLDGSTPTMTAGAETLVCSGNTYIVPAMGGNYTLGVALARLNNSSRPQTIGWVKNGDGVGLAYPSQTVGSRVNIDVNYGNSILFDGANYLWTLSGQLDSGIVPPHRPESGYVDYTVAPVVAPDFIFQDTGNGGELSRIAMTGDVSRVHSNLVPGNKYYFSGGVISEAEGDIYAGMALTTKDLNVTIQDNTKINNLETTVSNHTITLAESSSRISALESGLGEDYNLPSYSHGFGLWFIKNGIDYMSGNDSQTRNFGHTNLDKPAPIPNLTNGVKLVSYEQHQNNGLISAKIGRDASGKGYLFLYGWDNTAGQWADGTTTSNSNRKGRFILLDNSQLYGTTKSVEKVFISKTPWNNDGVRQTIVISVYDSSDSVNPYKCYAWGYASDNAGDTWRLYPHSSNLSTSPVLVKNGKLVACAIGVLGAYYSFDEGAGVTGRLYYCGYYTANYMNGTGLTSNLNTLTQCKYSNSSNITTCKDIVTSYDVAGVEMRTMLNFEGEQYSCGYNANGQLGTGNTTSVNLFTKVNIPVISGSKIIKIEIGMKNGFSLTSDGRLYGWGQNYDYILNDNTITLNKGISTIVTTGANNPVLNTTYSSPLLIASNVENFWLRKFGHVVNKVLIWKESTTKKLYMNGSANNILAVDDLSTRTTIANYRRQLALPDSYEQSNYEPLDVQFIGKITEASEYFVGLMVLVKNKTTNKKYLVRSGYMHNLIGFSGDFTTNRSDYAFIFMND